MLDSAWDEVVGGLGPGPVNIKINECCDSLYSICIATCVLRFESKIIIYLPEASVAPLGSSVMSCDDEPISALDSSVVKFRTSH